MKVEDAAYFDDCEVIKETEKAILVKGDVFDEEVWIPKSVIHDDSEVWEEGHMGVLVVQSWFAIKEGWVGSLSRSFVISAYQSAMSLAEVTVQRFARLETFEQS